MNVIIRVDDVFDKFDFYNLKKWFIKKYPNVPVCFYVNYTHINYMWDKVGWNQVKKIIVRYGWEIGGHSRNHPNLKSLSKERLKNEIEGNLRDIERGLNSVNFKYRITSFAYPIGEFNEDVKEILKYNKIIHGLTYPKGQENFVCQLSLPQDLYEIGVSSIETHSIKEWNKRFELVYRKGDLYILSLHTSQWTRGDIRKNFLRIISSKSITSAKYSINRFRHPIKQKSMKYLWNKLDQHLNFISKHPNVHFTTFKKLIA